MPSDPGGPDTCMAGWCKAAAPPIGCADLRMTRTPSLGFVGRSEARDLFDLIESIAAQTTQAAQEFGRGRGAGGYWKSSPARKSEKQIGSSPVTALTFPVLMSKPPPLRKPHSCSMSGTGGGGTSL